MTIDEIKKVAPISRSTEYIITKVLQKHGEFTHVKYARPLKFKKEFEESNWGFKITEGVFRVGINYENLQVTKEKRAEGEEPTGSKGTTWLVPHYLLRGVNDKVLVRLYTVPNGHKKVAYELNGQSVEQGDLKRFCLASEFIERDTPLINVDVENFLEMS